MIVKIYEYCYEDFGYAIYNYFNDEDLWNEICDYCYDNDFRNKFNIYIVLLKGERLENRPGITCN